MATADQRIRSIHSAYPPIEPRTGIPMELALIIETHDDQTIVTTGSYYSGEDIYDTLAVTDRDSYRVNERRSTLHTSKGKQDIASERRSRTYRPGIHPGHHRGRDRRYRVGLPAMRVLDRVQSDWDAKYGQQLIVPGRPFL